MIVVVVELERDKRSRWVAVVRSLPGVYGHGATREEAVTNTLVLALRVLADCAEHGELPT